MSILENIQRISQRIEKAAGRVGRDPKEITLVIVTKTVDLQTTCAVLEAQKKLSLPGLIAENRVKPALEKYKALKDLGYEFSMHFIGHVQSKKASAVLECSSLLHSVHEFSLAEKLEKISARLEAGTIKKFPILLQVNTSGEANKQGLAGYAELLSCLKQCQALPHIHVQGIMTMAALVADEELIRSCFRRLREFKEALLLDSQLSRFFSTLDNKAFQLSMGMSEDFELAIEEGATIIRLGSAVFQ